MIARRVNDVEQHREKEIANQDCERAVYHCLCRGAPHAHRALARGQSLVATNEDNHNAETESFRQAHDDVAVPGPAHHVSHVVGAVNLEQKNCDKISGGNADGDALGHQKRHRNHHGESAWHDEVIGRINRESAQRVDLLGHFHRANLGRHGCADPTCHHQSGEDRAKFAANRNRNNSACSGAHAEFVELEECLRRKNRSGEAARDYDNDLREQAYLYDLIEKQLPTELVCENRTKCVRGEEHDLAEILKKREKRAPKCVEETNDHLDERTVKMRRAWFKRSAAAFLILGATPAE